MYYHASQIPELTELIPHVSNHGVPLVYLSSKRENVLVYLSNAVEKHCKKTRFEHTGFYKKWASYGFKNGILRLEEYYPNATMDTYQDVCGYIYSVTNNDSIEKQSDIPFAFITKKNVQVDCCEYVPNAYDEIMQAVCNGKITLRKYEDNNIETMNWIKTTVRNEYVTHENHPEYQAFLRAKFYDLLP